MSDKHLEPTENINEKDDSVIISVEDVPVHFEGTENGNTKKDEKEKVTTQDNLDEIQQVSCSDKDKVGPVRRSRRTVIYVYLCPRFTFNLFSRAQKQHVQPQPQTQKFGFANGSYTVFTVTTAKSKGEPVDYDKDHEMHEDDEHDRNFFVRKVFSICSVMLVVTVTLTVLAICIPSIKNFMASPNAVFLLVGSFIGTFCVQYTYCCSNCSRIFPINYSLNVFVTICFSYITSYISVQYAPLIVISSASITLITSLVCLGLAYTSFDFTRFILPATIALLSFLAATITCTALVTIFAVKLNMLRTIVLILSAMTSSTMLVVESQMILGGKAVIIGEEDFTFGAYMAYNSIINIFLKILGVINFASSVVDDNND